jgi:hypothetical protein
MTPHLVMLQTEASLTSIMTLVAKAKARADKTFIVQASLTIVKVFL